MVKKEYIVYLVFITMASVLLGMTFAFLKDFPTFVQEILQSDSASNIKEETTKEKETINNADQQNISAKKMSASDSESQVLTKQEIEEIKSMIASLGIESDSSLSEALKQYQETKALDANGILTLETLDAIIKDMTIKRTASL